MDKIKNLPENLKQFVYFNGINNSGYQMIIKFPNGYGASVINNIHSYTDNDNEFEIAVIKKTGPEVDDLKLCYDTPITDDVIGHLEEKEVIEYIYKVKDLES